VPLVTEPSPSEVEIPTEKLKWHKLLDTHKMSAQLIQAQDKTLRSEIHKCIISIWNVEELFQQWKKSIIVPIYEKGDKPDSSNY
jgi:hypothetical protein